MKELGLDCVPNQSCVADVDDSFCHQGSAGCFLTSVFDLKAMAQVFLTQEMHCDSNRAHSESLIVAALYFHRKACRFIASGVLNL